MHMPFLTEKNCIYINFWNAAMFLKTDVYIYTLREQLRITQSKTKYACSKEYFNWETLLCSSLFVLPDWHSLNFEFVNLPER